MHHLELKVVARNLLANTDMLMKGIVCMGIVIMAYTQSMHTTCTTTADTTAVVASRLLWLGVCRVRTESQGLHVALQGRAKS